MPHCNATGTAGGDDGQLQYAWESGLAGVDAGTEGQVLVSQGAGNPPKFATVAGLGGSLAPIAISGAQDGANRVFMLPTSPTVLLLWRNGQLLRAGAGNDYTLSGATITLAIAPAGDDWLFALGY